MEDVVAAVVFSGPLHGDDVLGVRHHADDAAVPLVAGADGTQPVPLRQVLADGTERDGVLGVPHGLGKGLHLLLRQGEDEEGQALGGLAADARQAGKLLHQGLQGRGKIFHRDRVPLFLGDCRFY